MGPDDPIFKAVLANPDDDDLRLAYSDHLEESGDPHALTLAQHIRLTFKAERLRRQSQTAAARALDGQADELYRRHVRKWNGPLHRFLHRTPLRMQVDARRGLVRHWEYRLGFVETLAAETQAFLGHADILFRLGPLREVRLVRAYGRLAEVARSEALWRLRVLDVSADWHRLPDLRPLLDACRAAAGPVLRLRAGELPGGVRRELRAAGHQLVGA
jgi:uncharacterized protein (TIGR02996 family)